MNSQQTKNKLKETVFSNCRYTHLRLFVYTVLFFGFGNNFYAGCIWTTTGASSSWTNPAAWSSVYSGSGSGCAGSFPSTSSIGPGDVININNNMTLTTVKLTIQSGATLNLNCCTFTVNGNVEFANGSYIIVKSSAWLKIQGNMINNNNSTNVNVNGVVTVSGNLMAGNGSSINSPLGSGSLTVSGGIVTDGTATIFGQNIDCPDTPTPCSVSAMSNVLLPVEMISNSLGCEEDGVLVSWVTGSEHLSDYFSIERSMDGVNWEVVGVVQAAGNSTEKKEYSYLDNFRTFELTYYRLKQFDQDGAYELFNLGSIDCKKEASDELSVFPNPSYGDVNIHFVAKEIIGNSIVKILDSNGFSVLENHYDIHSGLNQFYFETQRFSSGFYYVQILNDVRASSIYKFVVMH